MYSLSTIIISCIFTFVITIIITRYYKIKIIKNYEEEIYRINNQMKEILLLNNRITDKYNMLCKLKRMNNENKKIADCLIGLGTIGIYGYGEMTELLLQDLDDQSVCIRYILDRNKYGMKAHGINVINPKDKWPIVDCIVVSTVCNFHEIEEISQENGIKNIVSLKSILNNN